MITNGYVTNVWQLLKIKTRPKLKLFTKPQVNLIMKHLFICSEHFLYPLFNVMKLLKINRTEAMNLKWENIADNQVHIIANGVCVRSVFVSEEAQIYLKYIRTSSEYILANKNGDKLCRAVVDRSYRKVREKFKDVFEFDVKVFYESVRKL